MPTYQIKEGKKHYWKSPVNKSKNVGKKPSKDLSDRLLCDGATITCEEYELGSALDKFDKIKDDPKSEKLASKFIIQRAKDSDGKYNVVKSKTKERINDKPLTLEEAESLINSKYEKQ